MSRTAFYCRCGERLEGASARLYHRCKPKTLPRQAEEAAAIAATRPVTLTPQEVHDLLWYLRDSAPNHAAPVERLGRVQAIADRLASATSYATAPNANEAPQ